MMRRSLFRCRTDQAHCLTTADADQVDTPHPLLVHAPPDTLTCVRAAAAPDTPAATTTAAAAERELMLIKLRAPAGPARTEVLQLAEIFRARVVDVSERGLTLCVSGDPGKVRV